MRFFRRSGTLIIGGVAAFLFFSGCQSTQRVPVEEPVESTEVTAPIDPVGEVPNEEEIVHAKDVGLQELEEDLQRPRKIRSKRPRSLEERAERLKLDLVHVPEEDQWKLSKGDRVLVLKENSRVASLDGVKVFLDEALTKVQDDWVLGSSDSRIILESAFGDRSRTQNVDTVVIDPGHGGTQDGTKNEAIGILEKEMTLDVSLRLSEHLEEAGLKVILTRYDDRLVGLDDRSKMANSLNADLFVSVHFNAAHNTEAQGLETFMLTPAGQYSSSRASSAANSVAYPGNRFDLENFELAHLIQSSLLDRLNRTDRGVKKARFRVLKALDCPGVLAECGFVSNQNEGLLISTAGYRERVAQALADAIIAYANAGEEES